MDTARPFGRLLRQLRKERDLTQQALAQQAACALDTVKKIEGGLRRPSRDLAEQFADCLALAGPERASFLALARGLQASLGAPIHPAQRLARLPRQPAALVGRAAELAALTGLFAEPAVRLVTIVGAGGMGKTRLAIGLAEQLLAAERFPAGVCFVALAPLDSAELIVPALAEALGLTLDASNQPPRTSLQQVLDYLRPRRLLLILDNVEHLLRASRADAADAGGLVAALLGGAPGVAILATSREHLRLREEHVFALGSLDTSDGAGPAGSSAAALFVQRARQLRPTFAPTPDEHAAIARICRMVDGMPLAIELAAGWIDTLAPAAIASALAQSLDLLATELRDVPARHRSIRAVFDASYERLSAAERAIFARLAIFRAGGTLPAVQAVALATLPQLRALIGASLLAYDAESGRYSLHELLRQYALERLGADPAGEREARERHAAYYCAFVERQAAELCGPGQRAALAAIEPERENARAACTWAIGSGRIDLLAQTVDGLGYFHEWRGYFDDGERAYRLAAEHLEAAPGGDQARRVLAMLRAWHGSFRRLQGDILAADLLLRESLVALDDLAARLDTRAERAFALLQLGLVASEGPLEEARSCFEESLALYRALGRSWEASRALLWLGDLARYLGNFGEARRHFRASFEIRAALGDERGIAEVLIWDSHAAAEVGQVEEAEALVRQSYALQASHSDAASRAFGLGELGVILMWAGKYAEARGILRQSRDLYRDLGNHPQSVYAQGWLAIALLGTGRYQEARRASREAAAQARALRGGRSGLAFLLHYAGWVALALGDDVEAVAYLQESVAIHRQTGNIGHVSWPLAQLGYAHWLLGDRRLAEAELLEVIRTGIRQQAWTPLLLALPAVALMLAEQGRSERAVELYALTWRHPLIGNAQGSVDIYGLRLDAVAAALPPDVAAAARARGQALDIWEAGAALERELAALGWSCDIP